MGSMATIIWGMFFGIFGMGYFVYGKKQQMVIPLMCGATLCIFPYFVSNVFILIGMGIALIALPYFFRF